MARDNSDSPAVAALPRIGILLVLALAPAVEIHFDVGDHGAFPQVVDGVGFLGWPNVLLGMLVENSYFAAGMTVAAGFWLADVGMRLGREVDNGTIHANSLELLAPASACALLGVVHGWWWAAVCASLIFVMRFGRARQHFRPGLEAFYGNPRLWQGAFHIRDCVTLIVFIAVPVSAVVAATDGRAWTPTLTCLVQQGPDDTGPPQAATLVPLSRDGTGVVGWRVGTNAVVEGSRCRPTGTGRVRDAFWTS